MNKNATFPYLTSEYDLQVEKMAKLGINTTGCTFEQSVNAALFMLKEYEVNKGAEVDIRQILKFTLYGRVEDDKMEDVLDDLVYNLTSRFVLINR